jgi:hypothetical protein
LTFGEEMASVAVRRHAVSLERYRSERGTDQRGEECDKRNDVGERQATTKSGEHEASSQSRFAHRNRGALAI